MFPWVGGKQALFPEIRARFPNDFRNMTYLEVFGGGGYVLLNKERSAKEIFNDYNGDLINFYRQAREHPEELMERLQLVLNSREDFHWTRKRLEAGEYKDDLQRAAYFYTVLRQSYGGKGATFGANPRSMWASFPGILEGCQRLQYVIIENWDFERVFLTYDTPDTFSYLDPPYFYTEDYYPGDCFLPQDHQRLCDLLLHAQGLWLLSYNYCPEVLELYQQPGVFIERVSRPNTMAHRYRPGAIFEEVLISNYDTTQIKPDQLMLFDLDNPAERRNYIWR